MTHKTGQGRGTRTGQCPAHFSQATSETRLFRRTLTCPLYRLTSKTKITHCKDNGLFLWSWRGSNPRPNREPICFLHVYFRLHCRAAARPEPPTVTLSSKASSWARGIPNDYSRYSYTAIPDASEQELLSDVSFQHLVPKLGQ